MSTFFIQQIEHEGPGIFKKVLDEVGVPYRILKVFLDGECTLPSYGDGVIMLGGPMNVDEELASPFLKKEKEFISNLLKEEVPLLGICLGAQLIAQVTGGKVFKAKEKEIGWYPVTLTEEGKKDPLFFGFPYSFEVFQWHEDTFEIPPNGEKLVTSHGCSNQVFKIGKRAYGIQFHLETDYMMINDWLNVNKEELLLHKLPDCMNLKRQTTEKIQTSLTWGRELLLNFLQIVDHY